MPPQPSDPQSFIPSFPPLAAFGGAPLYVTGEDVLCVTVNNAAAGVTVTISGRVLEFGDTRPKPFTQTIVPATDRTASVIRLSIGDGWLLNAQALVSAGSPAIGQTFARLSLCRGMTTNAVDLFTLAADYITAKQPVSYPGSAVTDMTDGAGALRSITGAVPGAGAEISETVPTGARWELLAFRMQLVTSATVANRLPQLVIDDGALEYFRAAGSQALTAGATWFANFGQGISRIPTEFGALSYGSLPVGIRLGAGHRIRTSTTAIQAGDQYSLVQYLVREWIEGA